MNSNKCNHIVIIIIIIIIINNVEIRVTPERIQFKIAVLT